jgi:amino acid transporter
MNPRGVPLRALVITWVLVLILLATGTRGQLFLFSSVAVLMQYGVSAASLAALSLRAERGLRPAHALVAIPALAIAFILGSGATWREVGWAAAALSLGLLLRWMARRRPREPKP